MIRWATTTAILFGAEAGAEAVRVFATLEPVSIPYHQTATYTIVVEGPAGDTPEPPPLQSPVADLRIAAEAVSYETLPDDRVRVSRTHTLDAIRTGYYLLPSLRIPSGEGNPLESPSAVLEVRDLTPAETEAAMAFAGNTLPSDLATGRTSWRWWIAGAMLVVAGAAALAYWRYFRHRPSFVPALSPWEQAHRALRTLRAAKLPEGGQFDAYYVELSRIVRVYIEDRFALHAPEQTTPEFLVDAASSGRFSADQQAMLARVLRTADLVKFARYTPDAKDVSSHFDAIERFVDDTTPRTEEGDDEGADDGDAASQDAA